MTRRTRNDTEGSWHHVMNRGIARRSLFETREDIRFFLAGVAKAVRRGHLQVHSWCVLTTHYHMLVRSPEGELSNSMRRIQNAYARYFNRSRRRDGPLHRGRFTSKVVDSQAYRKSLTRYIDDNPVAAGITAVPSDYPWSSARQYVHSRGPAWLQRDWVEGWVSERSGTADFDPSTYPGALDPNARAVIHEVVMARQTTRHSQDNLDSLLAMAPPATLRWLKRKAVLADGAPEEPPYVTPALVQHAIEGLKAERGPWPLRTSRQSTDAWLALHAGLLRDLAAATFAAIGSRCGVSSVKARRLVDRHQLLITDNESYGLTAAFATQHLLDQIYGT